MIPVEIKGSQYLINFRHKNRSLLTKTKNINLLLEQFTAFHKLTYPVISYATSLL